MMIELPIMIAPRADLKGIQKGKLYGTITIQDVRAEEYLPRVGPRGCRITEPLSPVERIRSSVLRNSLDF